MRAFSILLALAMLALGYVLGRQSVGDGGRADRFSRAFTHERVDRPATPTAVPEREESPAGTTATPTNPDSRPVVTVPPHERPDRGIYLPVAWDEGRFVLWYRSHAATYKFAPRTPEQLRGFAAEVVSKLGRIPRRELLDALLDIHAPLHAAIREVEEGLRTGTVGYTEVEARLAPARRQFSDRLYRALAFSDYSFLTREWADDKNPFRHFRHEQAPTDPRPQSGDPYEVKLGSLEEFVAWYQAYRHDLELPARDHDFLNPFFNDIVQPLGRVPRPKLMRTIQDTYAAYQKHEDVRKLFHGLRPLLDPIDYDRIRWSENWSAMLQDLGLRR